MSITYIIQWWDDCGKSHTLHVYSLDDRPLDDHASKVRSYKVRMEGGRAIILRANRLYINTNLSDKDYADFFEVIHGNGNPSKIILKKGKSENVEVETVFESVGKSGDYSLATTNIKCGNIPDDD